MRNVCLVAIALVASLALSKPAAATTIDFESFTEGDILTNQIAGIAFTDLYVLTSGAAPIAGTLNETEFPPASDYNVASNCYPFLGTCASSSTIAFSGGVSNFSGYFTYFGGLTLDFYDGVTLLTSLTSLYTDNYVSSGNPVNELLQFSASNITSVVINGAAYSLDDLSFTPASPQQTPVPEPSSMVLLLTGAAALARRGRSRSTGRL